MNEWMMMMMNEWMKVYFFLSRTTFINEKKWSVYMHIIVIVYKLFKKDMITRHYGYPETSRNRPKIAEPKSRFLYLCMCVDKQNFKQNIPEKKIIYYHIDGWSQAADFSALGQREDPRPVSYLAPFLIYSHLSSFFICVRFFLYSVLSKIYSNVF